VRRIVDYPRQGKRGWRRFVPSWRLVLGSASAVVLLGVIGFAALYAAVDVPDPNKLVTANASVVYWADGKTELGRFADVNRESVPLSTVPDHVQHAVLSAEDRTFYSNMGFSPKGIARAAWVKVSGGSKQGGSTITQQYVKNYFLTQERTITRKAKEFVISLKVEQKESKDEILQNYLNTIYFGRGSYGVQTASEAYFGRPVDKLTVSQGALLAAIIRSPGLYDPVRHEDAARSRWTYVLDGMVDEGWLSPEERAKQKFPKVIKRKSTNSLGGTNGYLLETVRREVEAKTGLTDADIDRGGLKIVSTFDRKAQRAAVQAIRDEMPDSGDKGVRAGLAAIKPGDGAVVAMYGGPDAVKEPFNAATQAAPQAGSTFKPFALAAALESGISLRSHYDGHSPKTFGADYKVSNFGNEQYGYIDLLKATASSVNTVYVQLNEDVGPEKTMDAAIKAGLPKNTAGLQPNLSNVLGTASPHVIDVADAFATFAAQGMHAPWYTVRSVTTDDGEELFKAEPDPKRVFSKDSMADLTYALQGVVDHGSGAYAGGSLSRPAAGKTGTSQESRSAWFSGYTPQLAASVGIYREIDGAMKSLSGLGGRSSVTGGSFPVRIWTAFMKGALDGVKVEQFPDPVFGGKNTNPPPATSTPTSTPTTTGTPTTTPTATETAPPTPTETAPPTSTETAPPTEPGGGGDGGGGGGGDGGGGGEAGGKGKAGGGQPTAAGAATQGPLGLLSRG
jgi:membrane peptidoglycan carboxypeptidase